MNCKFPTIHNEKCLLALCSNTALKQKFLEFYLVFSIVSLWYCSIFEFYKFFDTRFEVSESLMFNFGELVSIAETSETTQVFLSELSPHHHGT